MDDPNSKRQCSSTMEIAEDRLSSLPDSILSDILSRFPTKLAVSTSVLSHRWRHLWTHIINLDFVYSPKPGEPIGVDISGFLAGVEGVLRQLTSPVIWKFKIVVDTDSMFVDEVEDCESRREYWRGCCSEVESLISLLCDRVVGNMDINLNCKFLRPSLPPCVFWNSALVTLDLRCRFDCKFPCEIILPCLKKLHIELDYHDKVMIYMLISSCPLLEDLELRVNYDNLYDYMKEGIPRENDVAVLISSQNLKRLKLGFSATEAKVLIDAPHLKYFGICENELSMYFFEKIPTLLIHVDVDVVTCHEDIPMYKNHIVVLAAMIVNAKFLRLAAGMADAFSNIGVVTLHTFQNLISLKLDRIGSWKVLFDFLRSSPNLMFLVVRGISHGDGECLEEAATSDSVPSCFSHLRMVGIKDIKGSKNDLKMIKYILTNATILEFLEIVVSSSSEQKGAAICKELDFCEELFTCSKGAPSCEIAFTGTHLEVTAENIKIGKLDCRNICWLES